MFLSSSFSTAAAATSIINLITIITSTRIHWNVHFPVKLSRMPSFSCCFVLANNWEFQNPVRSVQVLIMAFERYSRSTCIRRVHSVGFTVPYEIHQHSLLLPTCASVGLLSNSTYVCMNGHRVVLGRNKIPLLCPMSCKFDHYSTLMAGCCCHWVNEMWIEALDQNGFPISSFQFSNHSYPTAAFWDALHWGGVPGLYEREKRCTL